MSKMSVLGQITVSASVFHGKEVKDIRIHGLRDTGILQVPDRLPAVGTSGPR